MPGYDGPGAAPLAGAPLGPGAGLSFGDIGGCNCGSNDCYPCSLPASSLTASLSHGLRDGCPGPFSEATSTGSATLAYSTPGGTPTWFGAFSLTGGVISAASLFIQCAPGCVLYEYTFTWSDSCGGGTNVHQTYQHPPGCSGLPGGLPLTAYTCSPLSITFHYDNRDPRFGNTGPVLTLTITP